MRAVTKGIWKLVSVNADGSCVFQEMHSGFASDEPKTVSAKDVKASARLFAGEVPMKVEGDIAKALPPQVPVLATELLRSKLFRLMHDHAIKESREMKNANDFALALNPSVVHVVKSFAKEELRIYLFTDQVSKIVVKPGSGRFAVTHKNNNMFHVMPPSCPRKQLVDEWENGVFSAFAWVAVSNLEEKANMKLQHHKVEEWRIPFLTNTIELNAGDVLVRYESKKQENEAKKQRIE